VASRGSPRESTAFLLLFVTLVIIIAVSDESLEFVKRGGGAVAGD